MVRKKVKKTKKSMKGGVGLKNQQPFMKQKEARRKQKEIENRIMEKAKEYFKNEYERQKKLSTKKSDSSDLFESVNELDDSSNSFKSVNEEEPPSQSPRKPSTPPISPLSEPLNSQEIQDDFDLGKNSFPFSKKWYSGYISKYLVPVFEINILFEDNSVYIELTNPKNSFVEEGFKYYLEKDECVNLRFASSDPRGEKNKGSPTLYINNISYDYTPGEPIVVDLTHKIKCFRLHDKNFKAICESTYDEQKDKFSCKLTLTYTEGKKEQKWPFNFELKRETEKGSKKKTKKKKKKKHTRKKKKKKPISS